MKKLLQCNLSSATSEYIPPLHTNTVSPNPSSWCTIYHLAVVWLGLLGAVCPILSPKAKWGIIPSRKLLKPCPVSPWEGVERLLTWHYCLLQSLGISGYYCDRVANGLLAQLFFLPVLCFLLFSLMPFHSLLLFPLLPQSALSLCSHCFSLSFHNSNVQSNHHLCFS